MNDIEQAIRVRAYELWSEGGCQHGQADAHWLVAQREILSASVNGIASVATPAVAKPKKAKVVRKKRAA